jgi:hypothetical protein
LSKGPSSSESSSVSQQYIQYLVDEAVMPMKYSTNTSLVLGGDVSLDHVVSHPIKPVVEEMAAPMQYSIDPTLLLKTENSKEVTSSMQYSVDPTLLLESDVSSDHVMDDFRG